MNKNMNSTIRPNTHQEQVEVLKAVIEKKNVYFYNWNAQLTRLETMRFVGTLPNFGLYRYDLEGTALLSKTRVRFTPGSFVQGMVQAAVMTPDNAKPLTNNDYHINVWFDEKGALHVEPSPGKTVVFHHAPSIETTPVIPPQDITAIIKKQRQILQQRGRNYRTAQVDANGRYMFFPKVESWGTYHALFKLKTCVLVSVDPISASSLRSWRIPVGEKINVTDTTVTVNGHRFNVVRNA